VSRQKTLFAEPPQDGDIEYIGQKLPLDLDFGDYILLEPEELADPDMAPGEELFTLEDDPDPPPQIDHTVLDVQLAIKNRDHLRFEGGDKVICGIPLRMGDGPNHWIYLSKVFEWVGEEWCPASDCLIVRPLGGKQP
jgi:hypothetical protein